MSFHLEACKSRDFSSRVIIKDKKVPSTPQVISRNTGAILTAFFLFLLESARLVIRKKCENKINIAEPGGQDGITLPVVMPFEIEQEPKIACNFY